MMSGKEEVTNLPGEAKPQLVKKYRGDMSCKEYMQQSNNKHKTESKQ